MRKSVSARRGKLDEAGEGNNQRCVVKTVAIRKSDRLTEQLSDSDKQQRNVCEGGSISEMDLRKRRCRFHNYRNGTGERYTDHSRITEISKIRLTLMAIIMAEKAIQTPPAILLLPILSSDDLINP